MARSNRARSLSCAQDAAGNTDISRSKKIGIPVW